MQEQGAGGEAGIVEAVAEARAVEGGDAEAGRFQGGLRGAGAGDGHHFVVFAMDQEDGRAVVSARRSGATSRRISDSTRP